MLSSICKMALWRKGRPSNSRLRGISFPNVNKICKAVRASGGTNIFIRYLIDEEVQVNWSSWFTDFATPQRRKAMVETFGRDCHGFALWPALDVQPEDLIVDKTRFGAFVPGSSKLHEILQERGIDTLIITGTATNVCCESTARDAMQMNYKIIFVADGNAALTDAEHNATLTNMVTLFADVMTAEEVTGFLDRAAALKQAAEIAAKASDNGQPAGCDRPTPAVSSD